MGKVKTRFIGIEEIEEKQKAKQKKRAEEKKRIKIPGKHKGGEKTVVVEPGKESLEKLEKAKELIEGKPGVKKEELKKVKKAEPRKRGKNYLLAKKNFDSAKAYSLSEALKLLKKIKFAKFDESVELHLNVQKSGLKGEVQLPHPTGKTVRVKIVDDKLLDQIETGKIDFDVLVARPSDMPKIAKVARILGPKGLMPNPKTGTVSDKPEETVKKFRSGVIRWKTEPKFPLIHQMIGKISNDQKQLEENLKAFIGSLGKGNIQQAFIKTTMSPSIRLDTTSL